MMCEQRWRKFLSTKYQQPQMTVLVLFFIENRIQTEGIAHFLPVKLYGQGVPCHYLKMRW